MRKYFFIVCAILSFISCRNNNKIKINTHAFLPINLTDESKKGSIDSIVASMQAIRLDIPKNVRLPGANISKLIVSDNTLFILDKAFASIKAFNLEGKYLYELGGLGLTDDKFLRIEDMVFNPYRKTLWVLCNTPSKIVEYSLNGKFIRKMDLIFFASSVGFLSPGMLSYHVNQNGVSISQKKNLLLADTSNSVNQRYFDWPKGITGMVEFTGGITQINNKVYYNPPFEPAYYQITDTTINMRYKIIFGTENSATPLFNRPRLGTSLVETTDYIGFNYLKNLNHNVAFYNKNLKKIFISDINLSPTGFLYNSKIISQHKDTLVLLIEPKKLQTPKKNNEISIRKRFPKMYDELMSNDTLQNNGNSIYLLKLTLKHL